MGKQKYDVVWLDYRGRHVIILADYLRTLDLTILVLESIDEAVARLPQVYFKVFGLEIVLPLGHDQGKLSDPPAGLRLIEDIQKDNIPGIPSGVGILVYTSSVNIADTKRLEELIGEENIFLKPERPEKIALRIKEIIGIS